jgi:hypothetical protein
MPVIKCSNIERFTKIDDKGRLRSYVNYNCINCNVNTTQRADEYNRRGQLCKTCKIKNSSEDGLKNRNLEQVCANIMFDRFNKRYEKKGLICNIKGNELLDLIKSDCHYCGEPPSNKMNYIQKYFSYQFHYNGLDRINSKKGYIIGNVVPCCKKCNLAKSDLSYTDFINHISKIYKHINNASNQM